MRKITKKLLDRICALSDEALVEILKTGETIEVSETWDDGNQSGGEKVTIQLKKTV